MNYNQFRIRTVGGNNRHGLYHVSMLDGVALQSLLKKQYPALFKPLFLFSYMTVLCFAKKCTIFDITNDTYTLKRRNFLFFQSIFAQIYIVTNTLYLLTSLQKLNLLTLNFQFYLICCTDIDISVYGCVCVNYVVKYKNIKLLVQRLLYNAEI